MDAKVKRIKQLEAALKFMRGALASSQEPWLVEANEVARKVLENKPVYKCPCTFCKEFEAWTDLGTK